MKFKISFLFFFTFLTGSVFAQTTPDPPTIGKTGTTHNSISLSIEYVSGPAPTSYIVERKEMEESLPQLLLPVILIVRKLILTAHLILKQVIRTK